MESMAGSIHLSHLLLPLSATIDRSELTGAETPPPPHPELLTTFLSMAGF